MSGDTFEVRRLAPSEVHLLQRDMPSWNTREYDRRVRAQERGWMLQVAAWSGERAIGRGMVLFPAHLEWSASAHRERCCEIRDVTTADAWRRRGVATTMMRELEAGVRENGFDRVGLSVGVDEPSAAARALYGALGYRHAHGPMISSTVLEGEDGRRIPVGGVLTYLVKDL
jgi:GNAT superfamily N-acetyltransferase